MTTYRNDLPQARGETMLTDGGLETTLVFEMGFDLPHFASFPLLETTEGRRALRDYFRRYAAVAAEHGVRAVFDTPTWRASSDWGVRLGYDAEALRTVSTSAVELLRELRAELEPAGPEIVISGNLGPRGDGYDPGEQMTADEAATFHRPQIEALADAGADLVTALTLTYEAEAVGLATAAASVGIPAVLSFTVETDGRLPTGQPLGAAIAAVDAATGRSPLAYGINCAHPDHFLDALATGGPWVERIGLVRANASRMSHAELDEATELDAGDPVELGALYRELRGLLPNLTVMGGCCGTDHGHVDQIGRACLRPVPAR